MRTIPDAGESLLPEHEPQWKSLGRYGPQNLAVTALQVVGWAALLSLVDAGGVHWTLRAVGVVLFCLLMQGVFTMMHEYFHRNAHKDRRLNYLIGFVTCTMFGTSPALLRVQHWGHHRRNRTEAERGEFIHDGESPAWKTAQYYFVVLGGLWLSCLVFPVLSIFIPYRAAQWLARSERFNSFAAGFGEFKLRDWRQMQAEGVFLLLFLPALVAFGPWGWKTLAVCYAAFGFSWSSLQWIYHLHTPIHVIEGAYNLRAPWLVRILFLNFNYNLTHHRHPAMPWQELHRASDLRETQPLWYRYLRIFRPPVPFPEDLGVLEKRYF